MPHYRRQIAVPILQRRLSTAERAELVAGLLKGMALQELTVDLLHLDDSILPVLVTRERYDGLFVELQLENGDWLVTIEPSLKRKAVSFSLLAALSAQGSIKDVTFFYNGPLGSGNGLGGAGTLYAAPEPPASFSSTDPAHAEIQDAFAQVDLLLALLQVGKISSVSAN